MDRVENTVSNSSSIVAREPVAVETCLFRGRYLATGLHAATLRSYFLQSSVIESNVAV
jgi:hypothetical protein